MVQNARTYLLLLTLFFCFGTLSAQNPIDSLVVTVVDQNGNPVPGRGISIESAPSAAPEIQYAERFVTDRNGTVMAALPYSGRGTVYFISYVDCEGQWVRERFVFPEQLRIQLRTCTRSNECEAAFSYEIQRDGSVIFRDETPTDNYMAVEWDLGDGTTANTSEVRHRYRRTPADYRVCLTIIRMDSSRCETCETVSIPGDSTEPCGAYFEAEVRENNNVSFRAQVRGTSPFRYLWDFGDGNLSFDANPSHTYDEAGLYLACLTITDDNGCESRYCDSVSVGQNDPGECSTEFRVVERGGTYFFFSSPQGTPPFTYRWNFGDGNTSSDANPRHEYANAGTYAPCLTIADANGNTCTHCDTVTVQGNSPCVADFDFEYRDNGVYFFEAANQSNNDVSITWDFGDGNTGTGRRVEHQYTQPGVYVVTLTVEGPNCRETISQTVIVRDTGDRCDASFSYRNMENNIVAFTSDATGPRPIQYFWNFGDGNTSSDANPRHMYREPGQYLVCLTIVADSSCEDRYCDSVIVDRGDQPCRADFDFEDRGNGNFFFEAAEQASRDYRFTWDFGDGNTAAGQRVEHQYDQPGTYTVTLTVEGPNCRETITQTVSWRGNTRNSTISGFVYTNRAIAAPAEVYLIVYDSLAQTLTAVDTFFISAPANDSSMYLFTDVPPGEYLIKAGLSRSHPDYRNFLPTYYGDVLRWNNADYVRVPGSVYDAHISLVAGRNPGGPAFVGGRIAQGAGKRSDEGDPMEGAAVILEGEDNDVLVYTMSGPDGNYQLDNLPYGTYLLYADLPGMYSNQRIVILSEDNPEVTDEDLTMTFSPQPTASENLQHIVKGVGTLYPNPATETVNFSYTLSQPAELQVEILDLTGQTMKWQQTEQPGGNHQWTLDISDLPAGVYLTRISADQVQVTTQRFIIVR